MGWFSTATALKLGKGAYGTVAQSLKGEADPPRTLRVALDKIAFEISEGFYFPSRSASARLAYWSRKCGRANPCVHLTVGRRGDFLTDASANRK